MAEQLSSTEALGLEIQTPQGRADPTATARHPDVVISALGEGLGNQREALSIIAGSVNCVNAPITNRLIELERKQRCKMMQNMTYCPLSISSKVTIVTNKFVVKKIMQKQSKH